MSATYRLHHAVLHSFIPVITAAALGCTSSSSQQEPTDAQSVDIQSEQALPVDPVGADHTISAHASTSTEQPDFAPIYFGTDQAALRPTARTTLAKLAGSIVAHPEWGVVTIEGHCDERGSDSYNLDLGVRRAAAIEHELAALGVDKTRLLTRSHGSMRPAAKGTGESVWRLNRRSELTVEVEIAALLR